MAVKRRDRTRLPGLSSFFEGWAELQATAAGEGALVADRVELDVPVELDVTSAGGRVSSLGMSGPTQMVETTVMPVFHRLRCRIEGVASEAVEGEGDGRAGESGEEND